jgi:hypothetical protein
MPQFIGKHNGAMVLASIVCQDENKRDANEMFVKHVRHMDVRDDSPFITQESRHEMLVFWDKVDANETWENRPETFMDDGLR